MLGVGIMNTLEGTSLYGVLNEDKFKYVPSFVKNDSAMFIIKHRSIIESIEPHTNSRIIIKIKDGSEVIFGVHRRGAHRFIRFAFGNGLMTPLIDNNGDMVVDTMDTYCFSNEIISIINSSGGVMLKGSKTIISAFGVNFPNKLKSIQAI